MYIIRPVWGKQYRVKENIILMGEWHNISALTSNSKRLRCLRINIRMKATLRLVIRKAEQMFRIRLKRRTASLHLLVLPLAIPASTLGKTSPMFREIPAVIRTRLQNNSAFSQGASLPLGETHSRLYPSLTSAGGTEGSAART